MRRRGRTGRPDRRTAVLVVLVLAVAAVFTGRLLQVQTLDAAVLARQALGNRLVSQTLPAQRGTITDRTGAVLAASVERYDITADPSLFVPDKAYPRLLTPQAAAAKLAPLLHLDAAGVAAALTPRGTTRYAVIAKQVTPATWNAVAALAIPGIYRERDDARTYPAGSVAGNVVGYLAKDGAPLAGLEYSQNALLTGRAGHQTYERGKDGQQIPMGESSYRAAQDGADVRLTLDEDLEYYAEQAIDAQVAKTGADWGTVVVMTRTGEVLAMAQSGEMDPGDPGATPLAARGDRALEDVIEPGSTGKVVTAAALVQEGLVTPATQLTLPNVYTTPNGQSIHDAEDHGTEQLTFAGVLAQSSNIGTVMKGQELGKERFYSYLRAFGLGSKQLGLPGETAGLLSSPSHWDGRTQYTVLFGQGYAVNVLQQAQVYATIANGGVRVAPHIVAGTTSADGTYHPSAVARGTRVVSASAARQVVSMLEGAVGQDGTGANADVPGFRVAGKTGTADDLAAEARSGKKEYTSSFIGMAPADDPQLVVAVTLQHPQTDHYGGTVAAPVFADVMSHALAEQHIAPTGTTPHLTPLTW